MGNRSDETYVFVLKGWSNHKTHRGVLGHYKWGDGSVRPQWLPACGARVDVSCLEVTSEPPHPSERCRRCFPKANLNRRRNGMKKKLRRDARVIAQTVNGGKGKLLKEQRGWLIYTSKGRFEGFLDETYVWSVTGHTGDRALWSAFPNSLLLGGEIPVSRSTFKFYRGMAFSSAFYKG